MQGGCLGSGWGLDSGGAQVSEERHGLSISLNGWGRKGISLLTLTSDLQGFLCLWTVLLQIYVLTSSQLWTTSNFSLILPAHLSG